MSIHLQIPASSLTTLLNALQKSHPQYFTSNIPFTPESVSHVNLDDLAFCIENAIGYEVDSDEGHDKVYPDTSDTAAPPPVVAKKQPPKPPPKKNVTAKPPSTTKSSEPEVVSLEDLLSGEGSMEGSNSVSSNVQQRATSNLDHLASPFTVQDLRTKIATPHADTHSPSFRELPLHEKGRGGLLHVPDLSSRQFDILAYENIILTTGMLRFLSSTDLSCVLSTIRSAWRISQEEHTEIISALLLEGMAPHISTSVNPSIHQKITPVDQLPEIFSKTSSLWYRLRLLREMEEEGARKRHLWLALNALILLFESDEKEKRFSYEAQDGAEQVIITDEHEFASVVSACLRAVIANNATTQDDQIFNALLEWTSHTTHNYPFPLNLKCYAPMVRLAAQSLLEVDSDEDDFDDEDEMDIECQEILSALKPIRSALGIDETCGQVAYLASLCHLFSTTINQEDQDVLFSHIREALLKIEEGAPFGASSGEARLQQELLFFQCFDAFGQRLINYTQVYGEHEELLKEHLQMFVALIRLSNVLLNGTATNTDAQVSRTCRYIMRGTAIHNFQLAKGKKPISTDLVSMLDFERHLYEEMQEEHEAIGQIFEELCEHCHIDYDTVMFSLLSADMAKLIEHIGELNPDVLHLFSILGERWISHICSELDVPVFDENAKPSNTQDESNGTDVFANGDELINIEVLFRPLVDATLPLLDAWLDKIKVLFQEYLDNAIRLENWKSVSDEIHYSSSAVDTIGFLERSVPFLKQIHLPIMKDYYRHYVQTCCGMVQKYCAVMVEPIPPSDQLVPFLPPIKKVKNTTLFSKKSKIKITPEEERYMQLEEKRLRFGKQFNRERLFIRLNNITFVRQKLLKMLARMDQDWVDTVENMFHYKMVSKEVDFADLAKGTCALIKTLIQQLIEFIARTNVYIHVWEKVFATRVYYDSTKDTPLQPLLPELDPLLGMIVENVEEEELSEVIIRAVFKCVIHVMEIILLDGGEHRIFYVGDHKLILHDLGALEAYFFQDGNGISSQAFLLHCTARLKGIAGTLMDKSSEDLINGGDFNQPFSDLPDRATDSPFTKELVYKILYHRRTHDKLAKKFLSKTPFVWG